MVKAYLFIYLFIFIFYITAHLLYSQSIQHIDSLKSVLPTTEDHTILNWIITAGALLIILIYRDRIKSKYALKDKQKQADNQLRESEERFRGIFNSMEDVFSRSDMEGKCVLISPSIFNLIGYRPEEIIGKSLADFYARPAQRFEIIQKLKHSGKVENFEIDIVKKDGEVITVSLSTFIRRSLYNFPMACLNARLLMPKVE